MPEEVLIAHQNTHVILEADDKAILEGGIPEISPDQYVLERICSNIGGVKAYAQQILERVIKPYRLYQQGLTDTYEKGILLYGPPGTGKSVLACNVCDALDVPSGNLNKISPSTIMMDSPSGSVTALKKHFQQAQKRYQRKKHESDLYVFFFDEIDAMLQPKDIHSKPSDVQQAIRSELQSILSGPDELKNIIIIGTTNLAPARFDRALLRNGRFSVSIHVGLPKQEQRREILDVAVDRVGKKSGWQFNPKNLDEFARITDGQSGSDLEQLVSTSAKYAAYDLFASGKTSIDSEYILYKHLLKALYPPDLISLRKQTALEKLPMEEDFWVLNKENEALKDAGVMLDRISSKHGLYGVILIRGEEGSRATEFCRRLLKKSEGFDNYAVIPYGESMVSDAVDALEAVVKFGRSVVVIDTIDDLIEGAGVFSSPTRVGNKWNHLVRPLKTKSVALVLVTTKKDIQTVKEQVGLQQHQGLIELPSTLTSTDMSDMLKRKYTASSKSIQKVISVFTDSCKISEFERLVHFYSKTDDKGETTWDIEGMSREYEQNQKPYSTLYR